MFWGRKPPRKDGAIFEVAPRKSNTVSELFI